MSLSVLAYNIKRVINIIGLEKLIVTIGKGKTLISSYFLFFRRKIALNGQKNPIDLSFSKKENNQGKVITQSVISRHPWLA